ncbi:MAG: HD domain-containing protein [Candidatus Microsaccharimonas sp.]
MAEQALYGDVARLMNSERNGHGMDHVDRVHSIAMHLASQEGADLEVVDLAALLHDVDDYKIFGRESAENLTNATELLDRHRVEAKIAHHVLQIIPSMGYNNYLEGKRPQTLEGQIVSDADMCDAIGSQGLIRVFDYNVNKGRVFFDRTIAPEDVVTDAEEYRASKTTHATQHFFDKLLNIPDILMTDSGRVEGEKRAKIMQDFLSELFREEGADDWQAYLKDFLG